MKLSELLQGLDVLRCTAPDDLEIQGLSLDSRTVAEGYAFVALRGAKSDGHDFCESAISHGASVLIVEAKPSGKTPYVLVRDTHEAVARLAARFYGNPAEKMRMIAVTGTNGKTTVTHILKGILENSPPAPEKPPRKVGLIGTIHTVIGDKTLEAERTTPDALSLHKLLRDMVDAGCTHCVMEASSHALVQKRVAGIQFNEAIFTNLTQDHLDYHKDIENYFSAKSILFDQCDVAILNMDDPYGQRLMERPDLNYITYSGERIDADVVAKNIRSKSDRVDFEAVTFSEIARIEWCTPGLFSMYNALAAVSCALLENIPLRDIAAAIRRVPPVKGRMEVLSGPRGIPIIIDYAHTPDALANILTTVSSFHPGRIVTVMGCGGDRDRDKRPVMGEVAARGSDILIVTSDNPRNEDPDAIIQDIVAGVQKMSGLGRRKCQVRTVVDRVEAIQKALSDARAGDLILLCGKGHETTQEVSGQSHHLDEREIVKAFLEAQNPHTRS